MATRPLPRRGPEQASRWSPPSATTPAAGPLREHLRASGVCLDAVVSTPGPSGSAVIVVDAAGENSIVVAPAANARLDVDTAAAHAAISASDVVLLQLEIPAPAAIAAARLAVRPEQS